MKGKNLKRFLVPSFILSAIIFISCISISGCGGSADGSDSAAGEIKIIPEETAYVAESVPLPEYAAISAAWADVEGLYYLAAESPSASGERAVSCYQLKPGAAEPEWLYDLPLAENQAVFSMNRDANGNFYFLGYQTAQTDQTNQTDQSVQNQTTQTNQTADGNSPLPQGMLWEVDSQGNPLLTLPLAEMIDRGGDSVPAWQTVDSEGRIFLSIQQNIYVLDPAGQVLFDTRAGGQVLGMVNRVGKVLVAYTDIDGTQFREIDLPAKKLVSVFEMPDGPFRLMVAGNGSLLLAGAESVYRYEPETNQLFKKFDWLSHDYTGPGNYDLVLPYGENGIAVIGRNQIGVPVQKESAASPEVMVFRELKEGEAVTPPVEKTVITLGHDDHSTSFAYNTAVTEFNKNNPDYKIEVKHYDEDFDRFYADIIAGNGADILVTTPVVWPNKLEPLGEIGALEDLYPYIDADESLAREDFFENILKAFETRGSLYMIPPWYRLRSIVAPTSLTDGRAGWSLEEFFDFAQSFPEERVMFDNGSKSAILRLLKSAYTGQLAKTASEDEEGAAEAPISRELLTKILAYANQYEDDENYQYDGAVMARIKEGQVKLLQTGVREGNDYGGLSRIFGEPVTFVGYPTPTGNGNLIHPVSTLAINADSEHKEGAWQFVSFLLSRESLARMHDSHQMYNGYYIRKDVLEHHFDMYRANFLKYGETGYLVKTPSQPGFTQGEVLWYPPDESAEADFDRIRELILSVDTAYRPIEAVDAIIEEEAAYYFNGAKPLEEVVDVIMNRVQTYVNEMD